MPLDEYPDGAVQANKRAVLLPVRRSDGWAGPGRGDCGGGVSGTGNLVTRLLRVAGWRPTC